MATVYLVKDSYTDEVIEQLNIETKEVGTFIRWLIDKDYFTENVYIEKINDDYKTYTF